VAWDRRFTHHAFAKESTMPATIVVGTQWGDEGKGKVIDWLAEEADLVARYAGGDNAGHTVTVAGERYALHLIPSGILYPGKLCLMGGGMVVNPASLLAEMDGLAARGVDVSHKRLKLSVGAHLILPYHIALDGAQESSRGKEAIGTTRRGIGPAYTDKSARVGLRAGAMHDPEGFSERVYRAVGDKNTILTEVYGHDPLDAKAIAAEFHDYARRLAPYLADVSLIVGQALDAQKWLLCEGAQGTLLDLDHGTYPFVTSSTPTVGGALTGLGFGPRHVERVVGLVKAYTTRVGAGPFVAELLDETGDRLRGTGAAPWDEFGTTTGRPRRCGWLDAVILRYATRVNGLTHLALTKLDILTGFEIIKIAVAYDHQGKRLEHLPLDSEVLAACRPIYEELPGWSNEIRGARTLDDLPAAACRYVERIEELAGVPILLIGVGPGREQTIIR
jgi:adenylosuccinate synthase